ncbi:hypothetical protein L1987_18881 [Smallanthus sonchifolius]|uniref:Uncharacterized protein n=1 Tax=Smallanthus sonchifolius TaxID=185202 RepID=A0ACB9J0T1_9ASTR|nr:hypothetical protein L1987_18881 [Smallanthus sonchifolius]
MKTANANGLVPIADPDLYSEEDKKLIERDNRGLGSIILDLSTELFEQHETAQGLWNALCLRFDGNAALQESRTNLLLKQYNMFSYKKNETLSEQNTTPDLKSKTLDEIIFLLESYELDAKKRELNNLNKPNSTTSCWGKRKSKPTVLEAKDLVQINPDDLEYMDLQWQMEMIAARAKKYLQKTGKDKLQFEKKVGFDKAKLRCYNCKQLGHFAREYPKEKKKKLDGNGVKLIEMIDEDEKSKKALSALMSKQLSNSESESQWALKTDNRGKGKAAANDVETSSDSEVTSEDEYSICSPDCVDKMQNYHVVSVFFIAENDQLKRVNRELKQNEMSKPVMVRMRLTLMVLRVFQLSINSVLENS